MTEKDGEESARILAAKYDLGLSVSVYALARSIATWEGAKHTRWRGNRERAITLVRESQNPQAGGLRPTRALQSRITTGDDALDRRAFASAMAAPDDESKRWCWMTLIDAECRVRRTCAGRGVGDRSLYGVCAPVRAQRRSAGGGSACARGVDRAKGSCSASASATLMCCRASRTRDISGRRWRYASLQRAAACRGGEINITGRLPITLPRLSARHGMN